MTPNPKFGGWFDQLLTTGLKILPGLFTPGGSSTPHPQGGLTDSGAVSAAIDQIAAQQHALEAQIGVADSAQLYAQMQALQAALSNPQYFDQTSKNEAASYLQQAKDYMTHNLPVFLARMQGQATAINPVTGLPVSNVMPLTGAAPELVPGVPNLYLFGGALAVTALLLLKK